MRKPGLHPGVKKVSDSLLQRAAKDDASTAGKRGKLFTAED